MKLTNLPTAMSRILLPVDFSLACYNAYRFALHLAEEMKLDVVLTHYYSGSIDPRIPLYVSGDGTILGSHLARLKQFAYSTTSSTTVPLVEPPCGVELTFETELSYSPAAAILKRAKQPDISLIVMPPKSSAPLFDKWLGSTATTVSEAANRPVFIVPPLARYQSFDEIVVANNYSTADPYPLWQLEQMVQLYGSKVHFIHVTKPEQGSPRFLPWKLMEELLERTPAANYPFEVATVNDEDISEGLMKYAEGVGAQLIVIVNQTRSRWRAMLRASLTQDLALRSSLPILVLHTTAMSDGRTIASAGMAESSKT